MSEADKTAGRIGAFGSIRGRLGLVVGLVAFGLIAVVAALSWIDGQTIYDARRAELKSLTQVAYKVVEQEFKEFQSGKLSEAEAQERAKAAVRAMRYDETSYFFVQDEKIVTIVHGARPDQEGVDGSKQVDATGKLFSVEMHDTAVNKGEGFVSYLYAKPGADMKDASPKISFVRYFKPWKWTIGTGVYIDDVMSEIWTRTIWAVGVGLVFLLVVCGLAAVVISGLTRRLNALCGAVLALADGKRDVALPPVSRDDEIGRMVRAMQVFKDGAIEKARLEGEAGEARRHADEMRASSEAEKSGEARHLQAAVAALGDGLNRLSGGDVAFRIETPFQAGIDRLRVDFNETAARLKETMLAVAGTASAIRSGTDEISSAADDLSRRTEQQAASLEETAAALDEITATVRKTAEGASHARDVVGTAKADAERSGSVVRQAVDAMHGIEQSSQQIGQIIGVIDEIAFQTNLLALNAGVEAARAGEAGRGFAVVASEVRALAQRSAEAAREIKALISKSAQQVEGGVDLVGQTGGALERIVAQITEINGIVSEIAASAKEQATGLNEVNTAVNQMDQVTQQNAAMVEQTTAASHTLARETEELSRLIAQFQVGQDAPGATMRASRKPAAAPARAAAKPVAAMKTMGRGGAARKAEAADWEEF